MFLVTQPTCVTSLQDEWNSLDRPPEGIIDQLVGILCPHSLLYTHTHSVLNALFLIKLGYLLVGSGHPVWQTKLFLLTIYPYYWKFCLFSSVYLVLLYIICALILLIGRQKERPACKNWVMRCWCGYLSWARFRLFAYGSANATASLRPYNPLRHLNSGCFYLCSSSRSSCTSSDTVSITLTSYQ